MRISVRHVVILLVALIAGAAGFYAVPEPWPELSRAEFLAEVQAGHVAKIDIEDQDVIFSESTTRGRFFTKFNKARDAGLPDELRAVGIEVSYSRSPPGI
jgi:hypothetical protein